MQPSPLSNSRTSSSPPKENLVPLVVTPVAPPSPQVLATTNPLSVSMDLLVIVINHNNNGNCLALLLFTWNVFAGFGLLAKQVDVLESVIV